MTKFVNDEFDVYQRSIITSEYHDDLGVDSFVSFVIQVRDPNNNDIEFLHEVKKFKDGSESYLWVGHPLLAKRFNRLKMANKFIKEYGSTAHVCLLFDTKDRIYAVDAVQ